MNISSMQNVSGGDYDSVQCRAAILVGILKFAAIPTGLGAGLLLMGGASLVIFAIATNCDNPDR